MFQYYIARILHFSENPLVKRLGRIAAKFPSERDVERANKPSQSNSQFKNADTGNKIIGGRGRGTLGEIYTFLIISISLIKSYLF